VNPLDLLAQHREQLLLAEAIGWLHDYRKCSDEHLKIQAANLRGQQALPRNELGSHCSQLSSAYVQLPISNARTVTDLLNDRTWNSDLLGQYLSRCHNTAHFDKQEPVGGKQNYPGVKISTPFGFERDVPTDLTNQLWALPWASLGSYSDVHRETLRRAIIRVFSQTIADTRRPVNEVDLWNWGLLVGALYKAALAGALLTGNTPAARDVRWRLLSVRVDGMGYLLNVARIPDLLARREVLTDSFDRVRDLIEVTYPLCSEVYRDENSSVYVVPDVPDLLTKTDRNGTTLQNLILRAFEQGAPKNNPDLQLGGEMVPQVALEPEAWWGQDPGWPNSSNDELPQIGAMLSSPLLGQTRTDEIRSFWQNGTVADICTVCGLRPQGPSQKAADRNVCDICEQRRADRSREWATSQPDRTIWTDEVADVNGRLALIVGRFGLRYWLDGSLVNSLLLIAPHDPQNTTGKPVTSKTPSFSRLRRIWETTRHFWQEVQDEILEQLSDDRRRLKIHLDALPDLGPFHVYDLELGATSLSVVWVPSRDGNGGYLLSADNLGYIARQLKAEYDIYTDPAAAAVFVEDYLRGEFVEKGRQPVLRNPDARAGQRNANLLRENGVSSVAYQENRYATAIPVLAEPQVFMMVVPADQSLRILRNIKEKYEREMGRVRDRLPLHLGCVYAGRRIPVRAVLDASRAMLEYRAVPERWTVQSTHTRTGVTHGSETLALELARDGRTIEWRIPLKMSDNATTDIWYPYFFFETDLDNDKADTTNRRAVKTAGPVGGSHATDGWVVHAADLRPGDTIYVWPSTFDFEFLDTAARRFEIHYDKTGRRPRRTRPFYLEDLDRLETLWGYMKRLSRTQRHQVIRTIEATREAWYGQDNDGGSTTDQVFRQFVADTLGGGSWPKGQPWADIPQKWRERLIQTGVRGELADLAELHMEILKE
jgi:hypothetical protein